MLAPAAARTGACCPPLAARHRTSSPDSSGNQSRGVSLFGVSLTDHRPARASAIVSAETGVLQRCLSAA
jgi:hypothetical protein